MAEKNVKKTKTVGKMPPTLLVGLGGTGCDIVGRVYKLANDEQKKYIQFAFLDTDANELRERKHEAPFAHTVQTSRKITVGQALRNDPEAYNNTFPINPQLMNKPLTEGAGQIRAVSKLAFDMCIREGRLDGLHEAINNLQKLNCDDMEQSIRVLVVSTLVGGTGSGILLPVSMYLRNYLENTCHKKPIIRGFCLLPDIFFINGDKTEVEKSNLRTNAYATLREIDAFMLRADSKMDADIRKRFGLKMPRPGTVDQYDDYVLNPLDYCFLFDAQNTNGETLNRFDEYKQHAADCIYASSVSRLHKRLNSSEDNTILERCAENGRNRYCGTGTSKIIYPFEAIRDYIALNWMSQAMTEDWLRYDKKVEMDKIKRQNSRAKGVIQPPVDARESYINYVDGDVNEKNYFGFAITEECSDLDKSGIDFTPRWETYYKHLRKKIVDITADSVDVEEVTGRITSLRKHVEEKRLGQFKSNFPSVAHMLKLLYQRTRKQAENKSSFVADAMFSVDNFNVALSDHIEHWLVKDGVPIHPNSARYFLYQLEKDLKEDLRRLESPVDDSDSASLDVGGYDEEDGFSMDSSFPEIEKFVSEFFTVEDYVMSGDDSGRRVNIIQYANSLKTNTVLKGDVVNAANDILIKCQDYIDKINEYYQAFLRVAILRQAIAFIDSLCKNYEYFYTMLETEIKNLSRRVDQIEETYQNRNGSPIKYVLGSKNSLTCMLRDCPNVIDTIQLTEEFRNKIFEVIFKNSGVDATVNQKQQRAVIKQLVSEDIIDFWRDAVIDQYGRRVDMDVVDALLKEAEYEEDYFTFEEKKRYVEQKYDEALTLAAPFIDKPAGQPYDITACGMSSEIADKNDLSKMEIMKIFGNYEKDSLMDRYQILFMKALYNLRVCDLQKFAPADAHPADPLPIGQYYKDYVARIDNILPDSEKSNVITPHLDRRWHFVGCMPDLDDRNEQRCINEAQKAFFAAFAFGYVRFYRDQYKFVDSRGDFISDKIVVADGKCDKLHEVYDAIRISRPLVRDFLNRYEESIAEESSGVGLANMDYTNCRLYKAMNCMHLYKFDRIPVVSYLELPLLFKVSVGNGVFNDDDAVSMLHNFIDYTEEYLTNFYTDNIARTEYFVDWLDKQTELMLSNVATYYDREGEDPILQNPFADILFSRLVNNIIGRFRALAPVCDKAGECVEKYTARWSELSKVR